TTGALRFVRVLAERTLAQAGVSRFAVRFTGSTSGENLCGLTTHTLADDWPGGECDGVTASDAESVVLSDSVGRLFFDAARLTVDTALPEGADSIGGEHGQPPVVFVFDVDAKSNTLRIQSFIEAPDPTGGRQRTGASTVLKWTAPSTLPLLQCRPFML